MAPRPYLSTAAAIVGAAVIVAGTPAIMPQGDLQVSAQAPTPTKISTAKYELTALSDISLDGLVDAYYNGWGGYIGSGFDPSEVYAPVIVDGQPTPPYVSDPYFPNINGVVEVKDDSGKVIGYQYDQDPVYLTGISGATYYLVSNALDDGGLFPDPIYHYYYEVGAAGGNPASAALYVAAAQVFGVDSVPAQLIHTVFIDGVLPNVQATIIGLASLTPQVNIGPVVVGGGNLASLYFTGSTIDGSYDYGDTGLPAIAGYIAASIANPPVQEAAAAVTAAPEVKALAATDTTEATEATDVTEAKTTTTKVETPAVEETTEDTTTTTTTTVATPKVKSPLSDLAKSFDNILGGGKSDKAAAAADGAKSASDSGTKSTGKKGTKSASKKASSSDSE